MTTTEPELYYDPFDFEIDSNPYPVWRRLREESPLYYNERYDFYALSRFDDVERGLVDWGTYSSAKGTILELIKSDMEIPPGSIIFEDPPGHDLHRGLLSRVFTPEEDERHRAQGPGVLRPHPRPARRLGRLRLHRRPRRGDADAHHRHAARHPRAGPGGPPRPDRRRAAPGGGHDARSRRHLRQHPGRGVRGLHRLAVEAPLRRPHDRAAPGRVRGRGRHHAPPQPRRGPRLREPPRRRRQRDHHPAHRLDRQAPGRAPRPAPAGGRGPRPRPRHHRGGAAVRVALAGAGPRTSPATSSTTAGSSPRAA